MLPRSRWLRHALLFLSVAVSAFAARERLLLDFGWRFQLGDPAGFDPAIFAYPEVDALERTARAHLEEEPTLVPLRRSAADINAAPPVAFAQPGFDDSAWRQLDLPHDWAVEFPFNPEGPAQPRLQGHGRWRRRARIRAPRLRSARARGILVASPATQSAGIAARLTSRETDRGGALWVEFDGVYRNCLVWLNGRCLGRNVSGYSSFKFDLAPFANYGGKNMLVVRVDATRTEGWFMRARASIATPGS